MHDDGLSCGTPHPKPMDVDSAKIFGNLDEVELFIGGGVREAVNRQRCEMIIESAGEDSVVNCPQSRDLARCSLMRKPMPDSTYRSKTALARIVQRRAETFSPRFQYKGAYNDWQVIS